MSGTGITVPGFFAAKNGPLFHTLPCVVIYTSQPTWHIDDKLIEEARRLGEHKTKREAVTTALEEYIQHCKQNQILDDFGTVDFDPEYDYKVERRRKRK